MLNHNRIEGLIAAPFTPMDKNGNVEYSKIPDYYSFLEKNNIKGAFINGTTGECASLTRDEQRIIAEHWAACQKSSGKVRVINLVGGNSYKDCIENAIISQELGISAIAVVAPSYFKPAGDTQLADFVALVGEAVPELPVYYYHIPVLTGVSMPMAGFLKKISVMLPNFAGIKFSHEDFMDFQLCLNFENGRYEILFGKDECLLSALALGCKGAVGSTYNYAAPLYYALIEAFKKNDLNEARKLQILSVGIVSLLGKYGGISVGKSFMKLTGMDCGEFRSPVKNMTPEMFGEFSKDVRMLKMDSLFSQK